MRFASRIVPSRHGASGSRCTRSISAWSRATTRFIWWRNHGSIPVSSASLSGLSPPPRARKRSRSRSACGTHKVSRRWSSSAIDAASGRTPGWLSSARQPLSSASGKVRPIAITSPTDFMRVPSRGSASRNFSNAQRGIFTTQ